MSSQATRSGPAAGNVTLRSVNVVDEPLKPPRVIEEIFPEVQKLVNDMMEEGPPHIAQSQAAQRLLVDYMDTSPLGSRIVANTLCSGSYLTSSNGNITYIHESRAASDPEEFNSRYGHYPRVTKQSNGNAVVVGTNVGNGPNGTGRANGPTGWLEDLNAIAAALASFIHNFVAALIGFFQRPSLPQTGENWQLPNIVLAETREPDQFHPAASYTYRVPPTPSITFNTSVSSPTSGSLALQYWNANKEEMGIAEVDIQPGRNEIVSNVVRPIPMTSGYFNVNVLDAPDGVTVNEVRTFPPAL